MTLPEKNNQRQENQIDW